MALATGMRVHAPSVTRRSASARVQHAPSVRAAAPRQVGAALRRRVAPAPVSRGRRSGAVVVQANLFARIVRIVKAQISNFTTQFEDPEVQLDTIINEMNEDLVKMRQGTAQIMASERQMTSKYTAAQATADDWLRRAELAVRKGQDDLAREALQRRKGADSAAAALKTQLDAQRRALEQLTANVRMLESKVAEARNKRESLKSRAAAAKSSKQVQEMVAGMRLNTSSAWGAFDQMEERVVAMEAEAEAAGVFATPDALEARFTSLEGGLDDELAALKRGMLPERTAAPAADGRPRFDEAIVAARSPDAVAIDAELDALRKRARTY